MPRTILVTDDEPGYRDMLKKTLTQKGFNVVTAQSSIEALQFLLKGGIDLVLTDIKMPNSDGLTLILAIRKHHGNIPVLVMTAFALEERIQKAVAEHGVQVLRKPFGIDDLAKMINAALAAAPKR